MEALESLVRFFASYPAWAKLGMLGGLLATVGIAVFAAPKPAPVPTPGQAGVAFMEVGRIQTFIGIQPEVKVSVLVNDTEFRHPSHGGVEWLIPGPGMSHASFRLPEADTYEVRFEMTSRDGSTGAVTRHVSQQVDHLGTIPFRDEATFKEYRLHQVAGRTRDNAVTATLSYRVFKQ